ncbi:MAG TPA: EscU/YscU/HrcU family type III secretion system export apparatus switch protein [Myxococcales bacterium]|nr:EscU/YscU/HrcU family type III secretion system export apparatus switch protein [Myxococcales bacterium]
MADENDNKTEQASEKRLRDAHEKGEVPVGRDAVMAASLAATAYALQSAAPRIRDGFTLLFQHCFEHVHETPFHDLLIYAVQPLGLGLTCCAAGPLAAIALTFAQTSGGFWLEKSLPDFERLFSVSRLTRLFSLEFLADLSLSLIKVAALGAVMFVSLRDGFLAFGGLFGKAPGDLLAGIFAPLAQSCGRILLTVCVLAGMDLAMTRYRFSQRMRMSKDEQRREHKDDEGDPMIKGRRRRKHRELAKARARIEVPRADALLVNPTHVAIALRYRRSEDKAPRVTAKGKGQLAEIMRDLARSNGIPIVEDIPLARLLHRKVKTGGFVPADTYKAVAAILAFVYRVTKRTAS